MHSKDKGFSFRAAININFCSGTLFNYVSIEDDPNGILVGGLVLAAALPVNTTYSSKSVFMGSNFTNTTLYAL